MGKITQASRYQYVCTQETVHELQKGALRANKIGFEEHIVFHNCDLSGAEFRYCNFKKGASLRGPSCIMLSLRMCQIWSPIGSTSHPDK